jgi:hypothetical protein
METMTGRKKSVSVLRVDAGPLSEPLAKALLRLGVSVDSIDETHVDFKIDVPDGSDWRSTLSEVLDGTPLVLESARLARWE